jgi:hypothetical protein
MGNLPNHHQISRSGKLYSVIHYRLKSRTFIKVDDLFVTKRSVY